MSCCNCCTNTLNLGCFNACGLTFDTSEIAVLLNEGIWTIQLEFGRRNIKFEQNFVAGDPIIFNLYKLNENYTYENVVITDPTGSQFTFTKNNIVYDCFKFSTKYNSLTQIILI